MKFTHFACTEPCSNVEWFYSIIKTSSCIYVPIAFSTPNLSLNILIVECVMFLFKTSLAHYLNSTRFQFEKCLCAAQNYSIVWFLVCVKMFLLPALFSNRLQTSRYLFVVSAFHSVWKRSTGETHRTLVEYTSYPMTFPACTQLQSFPAGCLPKMGFLSAIWARVIIVEEFLMPVTKKTLLRWFPYLLVFVWM